MHILLVEPAYYTRYPPLGLLKLASYHRSQGDTVELVRGCSTPNNRPDKVYVTSLFTWGWNKVWEAIAYYKSLYPKVEVSLGGIYASLMPDHAKESGADRIHIGLVEDAEDLLPAYDLVPQWKWSILFASRGCINKCKFCAVPIMEGSLHSCRKSIKHLVYPGHKRIVLWDNNILASPNFQDIVSEAMELGISVDYNQGLDAMLITPDVANTLSKLKMPCIRVSYDLKAKGRYIKNAIDLIKSNGVRGREIFVYVLYNFDDTPDEFFSRVQDVLSWGAVVFPMRFEPLDSLTRNNHISPSWDKDKLEMVEKVRRVLGFSGTLPPYTYLVERFSGAVNFDEGFREPERLRDEGAKLRAHKVYNKGVMRGETDWRVTVPEFTNKQW
ncbi:hypothetical protein ACFLT4_00890 [Chloroflexota bacterium]